MGSVEVALKVRTFVVDNFLFGRGDLKDDQSFLDSGIIDSTGILELVAFLENDLGVPVADSDLVPENLDSVSRITRFVGTKL